MLDFFCHAADNWIVKEIEDRPKEETCHRKDLEWIGLRQIRTKEFSPLNRIRGYEKFQS
jgi:hypothetical protein